MNNKDERIKQIMIDVQEVFMALDTPAHRHIDLARAEDALRRISDNATSFYTEGDPSTDEVFLRQMMKEYKELDDKIDQMIDHRERGYLISWDKVSAAQERKARVGDIIDKLGGSRVEALRGNY